MENLERLTLTEMEEFLRSHRRLHWPAPERESVYALMERVLKAQQYRRLSKRPKGIVGRFLAKVTRFSRAQLTRWIQRWRKTQRVQRETSGATLTPWQASGFRIYKHSSGPARRPKSRSRYTASDIASLAEIDAAHQDLSGPAVRHLCQRLPREVIGVRRAFAARPVPYNRKALARSRTSVSDRNQSSSAESFGHPRASQ